MSAPTRQSPASQPDPATKMPYFPRGQSSAHDPATCATCSEHVPQVLLRARRIIHHGAVSTEAVVLHRGGSRRICDWGES